MAAGDLILARIYSIIDKDEDGTISKTEVALYLKELGFKSYEASAETIVKVYDTDGNGTIDKDEFATVTKQTCASLLANDGKVKDIVQKVFGGEGIVTAEKLEKMLKIHGYVATGPEISDMLKLADANGDGEVTFEEFLTKMAEVIVKK